MQEIFFRKLGRGKPVVLIHGFCETQEVWNGFAEKLAELFEVFVIDLPGFGDSPLPATPFLLSDISEKILNWINQQKIRLPFIVGHSLGGYVALSMAKLTQKKLSGLCLFNSTPHADSDERKSNRDRVIEFVKKNGVDPFVDTYVPGLFYDKNHPAIPFVYTMARKTMKETLIAYSAAMRDRTSSIEFLKKIEIPVLTIGGQKDTIVSAETTLEFGHFATNSTTRILNNTGHMGMLEQPEMAARILADFISRAK